MLPWARASIFAVAPSLRKVLVASRGAVRALDIAFLPVALTIMEALPTDLLVEVMIFLFSSWPCWPRVLCVSAGFAAAAQVARRQLGPGEWYPKNRPTNLCLSWRPPFFGAGGVVHSSNFQSVPRRC